MKKEKEGSKEDEETKGETGEERKWGEEKKEKRKVPLISIANTNFFLGTS